MEITYPKTNIHDLQKFLPDNVADSARDLKKPVLYKMK